MRINGLGFSNMTVSTSYVEPPVIVENLSPTEAEAYDEYVQKYGKDPTEPSTSIDIPGIAGASIFGVPVLWIAGGLVLWLIFGKKEKKEKE
jgi:hypothetical protein